MLASTASVLLRRPLPLFDPKRVDIDAVGLLTRRMALPVNRPYLAFPNPLFMREIVSEAQAELIMTDLATWKDTRFTKDEMVARLVWQQGMCNAVAWHVNRAACVRQVTSNPEWAPVVIDLTVAPEQYDLVYDALMGASVKYVEKISATRLKYGFAAASERLEGYVEDALRKIRAEVLKYEVDRLAEQ
jgi:hypothetical protein